MLTGSTFLFLLPSQNQWRRRGSLNDRHILETRILQPFPVLTHGETRNHATGNCFTPSLRCEGRLHPHGGQPVTPGQIVDALSENPPVFFSLSAILAPHHDLVNPATVIHHVVHLRLCLQII